MEEEKIINAIRKMVANDADTNYYGISGAEIHDWLESKSSNEHSALQFAIAYLINNGYNRTAKCLEKYFNYAPDPNDAERKQLYSDGFDTARKALDGTFMQYIDEHRPEGKMCLSNGECAQLHEAFKNGDVETIVRYIHKYQQPAKPQPAEGVCYIKDGQPVAEYEDGVETDRLLVIGKYCRFYLSMADLGRATYEDAQNKAASLGEGWRCPDSFEGRTIGKMSNEIREKAAKIGAGHFNDKGWFWTNEVFDCWNACDVNFDNGNVGSRNMDGTCYVLALSAFQN